MDGVEKRVFRRKHGLLSTLLKPTPGYLSILKQQGLLTAKNVDTVLGASDRDKMATLLTLLEAGADSAFTKVCFMLEQTGHSWVADELHADLQWERGKLDLEPYITQEAEYIANTLLGERGFIDVSRKGDLTRSIASRHQVAKEAWKRQSQRRTQLVVDELQTVQKDVLKMFEEVDEFLRVKDKGGAGKDGKGKNASNKGNGSSDTAGKGHGSVGGGSSAGGGNDIGSKSGKKVTKRTEVEGYGMAVRMLQDKISTLNEVLDNEITQHEKLHLERKKCYDILGGEPEDGTLDEVLQATLSKFSKELGQSSNETQTKKKQVSALDQQVRGLKQDLTSQISQKNVQLEHVHRNLKQTERMLKNAREDATDMARKRDIYKTQVDYWKERCELLEKTRRLGYYHISKVGQPVSLATAPGSFYKRPLYYDPELLEVQENVVYIKGDPVETTFSGLNKNKNTTVVSQSQKSKTSQEATLSESPQKDYPGSPRKVSQYHTKCVPNDDVNLNSNNSNSNLEQKKNSQTGPIKMNSKSISSLEKQRPQSTYNRNRHVSFSQDNTKANGVIKTSGVNVGPYTNNPLPVHPYASQYQPVTSERARGTQGMTSRQTDVIKTNGVPSGKAIVTSQKLGVATHRYELQKAQTLPSGVYRPAPPPTQPSYNPTGKGGQQAMREHWSEAGKDDGIGGKENGEKSGRGSRMTANGYVSYNNGMLGLNQGTQTSRPGSSTKPTIPPLSHHGDNSSNYTHGHGSEKTPKEKFEESLQKQASASSLGQSHSTSHSRTANDGQSNASLQSRVSSGGLDQSYGSVQSKRSSGYSSLSSVNVGLTDSHSEIKATVNPPVTGSGKRSVTVQGKGREHALDEEHCRCCPRCCREAPTSHPYSGYIS